MDWFTILFLFGLLACLVWLPISWWRIGVGAEFYFGRALIAQPVFVSLVMIASQALRAVFRDEPFSFWPFAPALAIIWALFLLLYTGGFIRGRFNRRRNDGIVGSKSW